MNETSFTGSALRSFLGCLSTAFALVLSAATVLSAEKSSETGWTSLFNGRDLAGWKQMHDGTFVATNGVLRLSGGRGWLCSGRTFTNFVFEVEWRGLETNFNSGLFLRAPREGSPFPEEGWQVNLKQTAVGELLRGSKKIVTVPAASHPAGEWVKFRIEARGRVLKLSINGVAAWEFNGFEPPQGHLGLQAEGKTAELRNLRIQELPD